MQTLWTGERNVSVVSDDLLYEIWLSRIFHYGNPKSVLLLEQFGTARAVYEASESALAECAFLRPEDCSLVKKTLLQRAELILSDCEKHHIRIVTYTSADYPDRFRNIYAPPVVLYVKGELPNLDDAVVISVVGTRKASPYGCRLTGNLCYELSLAGAVIVSGCAEGIDTYAHWGTLKAGGRTIALLGCGLDINYPAKNQQLKEAILKKQGALLSECAPGERVTRFIFPVRNRLISALSVGVLLTEVPLKSGALITAEHAIEQGKDLFCVPPHDIYDPRFAGVSNYLRDGAKVVFSARDVLEEYQDRYPEQLHLERLRDPLKSKSNAAASTRSVLETKREPKPAPKAEDALKKPKEPMVWDATLGEDSLLVYEAITEQPTHLDDIAAVTQLPIYTVTALITELELRGYITAQSGKRYLKSRP